ncbi:FecR domain-containing protein [Thermodesulfobacteriota bacterium]
MKHIPLRFLVTAVCTTMLAIFLLPCDGGAESCDEWVARVESVQGSVHIKKAGQEKWVPAESGHTCRPGDMIRVQERSRADVLLCGNGTISFDQNTILTFVGIEKEDTFLIELLKGAANFFSRIPRVLTILTPYVNGYVKGTEFLVKVDPDRKQTFISVFEGKVAAENEAGDILLASGQSAVARKGEAPQSVTVVRPRDAVQWALYYPPILSYRSKDFPGSSEWEEKVRQSIDYYWSGQLAQAFSSLKGIPDTIRDPRFFVYRAGLLLTVGRVDEARPDIQRAPANSEAYALEAVIAVVQNDKKKAMEMADKAVEMNPRSSVARVAMSYAQQAHFDLEGALKSLEEATTLDGDNAIAWARLSEMWLSLGYLDKALVEAKKAASINPNLSRSQSVLGFAYLSQIKIKEAKKAFEEAISMDQTAPLPRLGLGLAKIREGNLKEGRREIEIAAALDPNNSLIRSYLGKAYFEEKRDPLDERQFDIAKQLDPNDPTPWFYDAIRLQSVNRPVEALTNLQKSIELNNNRAVYRSRLMLDKDLAARSASLGRIYRDLGFEQLALVEGWKSVNTDPTNFSGHRFLADTYSALPRHEIARVSELLQSQLLQPININPIQPSLAESNQQILTGAGPTDPAFNEFNPLFNRNRVALQANAVAGENDTKGDDLVFSGVYGKFSFSAGQNYYKTDGFRENNDLEQRLYNVFAQASLTHKTGIQAEYRYTDREFGDLPLRFDPDYFFTTLRHDHRLDSIRVGLRHEIVPQHDLIANFQYGTVESSTIDTDPFFSVELQEESDGIMGEAQYIYRSQSLGIISGAGYFNSDREISQSVFGMPPIITNTEIDHNNMYIYANIKHPENFIWTLGASGDFFEGTAVDKDQFNPKFGITYNPLNLTSFRVAAFSTLQRTLISNQTIEPTQVAGFNQFFNDQEGVEAWRYGIAFDQQIPLSLFNAELFKDSSIYSGLEYSRRDLNVPFISFSFSSPTPELKETDWYENILRAYVYWAPIPWISFSAEYLYEKFDRGKDYVGPELYTELKTHRFPFQIGLFHRCGLSAKLRASYADQKGKFGDPDVVVTEDRDRFWIIDAGLSYRLPKRYGVFSVEIRNLFDESLKFQDTDSANLNIYPERIILGKITISF